MSWFEILAPLALAAGTVATGGLGAAAAPALAGAEGAGLAGATAAGEAGLASGLTAAEAAGTATTGLGELAGSGLTAGEGLGGTMGGTFGSYAGGASGASTAPSGAAAITEPLAGASTAATAAPEAGAAVQPGLGVKPAPGMLNPSLQVTATGTPEQVAAAGSQTSTAQKMADWAQNANRVRTGAEMMNGQPQEATPQAPGGAPLLPAPVRRAGMPPSMMPQNDAMPLAANGRPSLGDLIFGSSMARYR